MPLYTYKGYDADTGAARKGKVEAESPKAARSRLRQKQKIIVSEMKEEVAAEKAKAKAASQFSFGRSVSLQDMAIMTRQFATLLSAHVPLDESLKALSAQVESPILQNTLSSVKDRVSEGKSLAEGMASFPNVFNKLYINMVRAGESSGTLGLVLERLADFNEYQVKTRGQIVSAITYPALMMTASGAVIIYLFVSVVPKLTKVFDNLKVTMPWYTQTLINISRFLQSYWYLVLIAAGIGYFLFRNWVATDVGRRKWDRATLRLPIFGAIIMRMNVSQFTKTLSTLLSSGVPIVNALEITRNIVTNTLVADVVEKARVEVQEGKQLGVTIEKSGRFPPLVVHMIMTGERTGQLEEMLAHVAVAYDAEVERKIEAMISIIEPVMVIVMAGISATVILALMMPMLSIMSQIR